MSRDNDTTPDIDASRIVYVRQVRPDEMPEGAPDTPLFSIHDGNSARIGVAAARELAFLAARQHDLQPVSVH